MSDHHISRNAASTSTDSAEHRHTQRRRTLKQGRIMFNDHTLVDCMIRDVSDTGARIVVGGPMHLPEFFSLLNISDNKMWPVKRLWQRGLAAGIAFTGPEQPAPHFAR